MKIKVLHLAESFEGGGAETVFRETVQILRKQGSNTYIHYVLCLESEKYSSEIDYPINVKPKGKIRAIISQIYSFRNYKLVLKALYDCNPSVIHVQNYGNLSPSILRAIIKYKSGRKIKVMHTVHTFEYICSHHAAFDYKKNLACVDCANNTYKFKIFYRGCSRLGYFHSIGKGITSLIANYFIKQKVFDQWITPSDFLKMHMTQKRLKPSKVNVIRNPVIDQVEVLENPNEHEVFKFVYFGRFSAEKNVECLINAFSILLEKRKDIELTLIGKGDEENNYISLIDRLKVNSHVKIEEFIPKEELELKLKEFQFSVIPSKCYETACLAIIEAVNIGLIPLATNHGGMKETIEIIDFGLTFENDNADDLASKMNNLILNYSHYYSSIHAAKKAIENIYNKNTYLKKVEISYEKK